MYKVLSVHTSKQRTGNRCPYKDKKNFKESSKNTLTVESKSAAHTNNFWLSCV